MKKILTLLCCFLLSSCYALRLELDDPLGLPLSQPTLAVAVVPGSMDMVDDSETRLASQLEMELIEILSRERHVRIIAACNQSCPSPGDWSLTFLLKRQESKWEQPPAFWLPESPKDRFLIALDLQAELLNPEGRSIKKFQLHQQGDASLEARGILEKQLLSLLRQRALQELQPQYIYR